MKFHAALAGIALLAAPVLGGTNLLTNDSFEDYNPLLGGFVGWESFGNVFPDEGLLVPPFDGLQTVQTFGGFCGTGCQSDTGIFQNVQVTDAEGKNFRATVSAYSPSSDPLFPTDFSNPDGDFGHLPLLLLQFQDSAGNQLAQPEVRVFDPTVDNYDEWVTYSVEGVAPAGTTQINFFCLLITWGDLPGSLFWDAGILEEAGDVDCTGQDDPIKLVDDSTAPWTGFMNVFELDGETYAFGSNWAVEDLTATFDDGVPSVSMSPCEIDTGDDFWYQNGTGGPGAAGNKLMEANLFQEVQTCLAGQTVEFSGYVHENSLDPAYESSIFIRDFAGDFSSFEEIRAPATPGPFSISLATIDDPSRFVQWGFTTTGPNVWPGDAAALGSVTFSSVPGMMGCNPADLAEPFGILDLSDITAFQIGFTNQTPEGDLNGDGIWDLSDITLFQIAFTAGCP